MLKIVRRYAIKATPEKELPRIGAFNPRTAIGTLPKVGRIPPQSIQLQPHPRAKNHPQTLLRAIDVENRVRYDTDKRSELFFGENAVQVGCILLVDQITSRITPQKRSFAGVLMQVRQRGLTSNFVLRNVAMGVGVEMTIPIFSPMVTKISVLKEPPADLDIARLQARKDKSGVDFDEIENIVIRYKNQQARLNNE